MTEGEDTVELPVDGNCHSGLYYSMTDDVVPLIDK